MCGITGVVSFENIDSSSLDIVRLMTDKMHHRGPDGSGYFSSKDICFGHRRLSIIDVDNGAQPFQTEGSLYVLTYNGEIYNFREIREELAQRGYEFVTDCDTEVLIIAWQEWGEAALSRLRGMFAFSIWDETRKCCYLVRDRLGIKPLYYTITDSGKLVFGSELKALLCHDEVHRDFDKTAIDDYFALGYVPDPKCIYKNIYKLEAGCFLRFGKDEIDRSALRYWSLQRDDSQCSDSGNDTTLHDLLKDAVKSRLISDVPLGAFLSGGVDSSSVASLMAQLNLVAINTCSIGFDEDDFDETCYASSVAKRINSNHYSEKVSLLDASLIDDLAKVYDEPFADSSSLPTYRLCELARNNVTVALSGDGGDEIFAGYTRYKWHLKEEKIRRLIPDVIRKPLFSIAAKIYPKLDFAPKWLRFKSTFFALSKSSVEGYYNNIAILPEGYRQKIYSKQMASDLHGYTPLGIFESYAEEANTNDPLWKVQYIDLKTYLVGDILTKVDRASMANSLEVRVPMLDHKLVSWAANLPSRDRMVGDQGKILLKKSMKGLVGDDILYRNKMGFGVPVSAWFRGGLSEHISSLKNSNYLIRSGMFDMAHIGNLCSNHLSGLHDNGAVLWSLLMFEAFLKNVHYAGEHE